MANNGVSTALVGYSDFGQLTDALRWAERGPLAPDAADQRCRQRQTLRPMTNDNVRDELPPAEQPPTDDPWVVVTPMPGPGPSRT